MFINGVGKKQSRIARRLGMENDSKTTSIQEG
jgi:hypothetical protein